MRVSIVQLSDIHLKEKPVNPVVSNSDALSDAIAEATLTSGGTVIALTGDIAYAGKVPEYQIAQEMIRKMETRLTSHGRVNRHYVSVPGNHDCDFGEKTALREIVLSQVSTAPLASEVLDVLLAPQFNYRRFVAELVGSASATISGIIDIHKLCIGVDCVVAVICMNSAWISRLHESPGSLHFPADVLATDITSYYKDCDLAVALMHHPYNWFEPTNARKVRSFLEKSVDIVLTGHEHEYEASSRKGHDLETVQYVEAAALQPHGNAGNSGFSVIHVDTKEHKYKVETYSSKKQGYVVADPGPWQDFLRNRRRLRSEHPFSHTNEIFLTDLGTVFTHPRKSAILLEDLFVYPDIFVSRSIVSGARSYEGRMCSRPLEVVLDQKRIWFQGPNVSGKTTLAKKICSDMYQSGYLPIFADPGTLQVDTVDGLVSSIKKLCGAQYSFATAESYLQLLPQIRALIIDDYHRMPGTLPEEVQAALLNTFDVIVIFGDDEAGWEQISGFNESRATRAFLLQFASAEILTLGYAKRSDLISNWEKLGRAPKDLDEQAFQRRLIATERNIDALIGKSLIPSAPVFLLIILQQMELQNNLSTSGSAHGFLYEALITASLRAIATSSHDIDSLYNYLSELAFRLRAEESRSLDFSALQCWHEDYCERYQINLSLKPTLSRLERASIIRRRGETVLFSYPYLFYYFVARYLGANMGDDSIKGMAREFASELHVDESANIMLFLAHTSRDSSIIDEMLQSADRLFNSDEICDFTSSNFQLMGLAKTKVQLILPQDSNPELNRREYLEARDQLALRRDSGAAEGGDGLLDRDVSAEVAEVHDWNAAFKTIQVLGQILRSFSGSLLGSRKQEIVESCYKLSLRMLGRMLRSIDAHAGDLLHFIADVHIKMDPALDEAKALELAKKIVFTLADRFAFSVVRHVSWSLGMSELSATFESVRQSAVDDGTSFSVIDLGIQLDHAGKFPESRVLQVFDAVRGNPFSEDLIRCLTWHHFYVFHEPYDVKQRVCQKLEIGLDARFLSERTKQTKRSSRLKKDGGGGGQKRRRQRKGK